MPRFSGTYARDWKAIADAVKDAAEWRCIRCGHPHDPKAGRCLTVHHFDGRKDNNRWHNLMALCQRCHLHIQAKVIPECVWMFGHSGWMVPYVGGYYAAAFGLVDTREAVDRFAEAFIDVGCGLETPAAVAAQLAAADFAVYPLPAS